MLRNAIFALVLVATCACIPVAAPAQSVPPKTSASATMPAQETLYKKLGGYDALAAVTDDFIARLASDKRFTKFFVGVSAAHKARIRQMVVDLLCAQTGGPCVYVGQDMKSTHKGLHITNDDWNASADLLKQSLTKFNVPADLQEQVLKIVGSVKDDIVEQ